LYIENDVFWKFSGNFVFGYHLFPILLLFHPWNPTAYVLDFFISHILYFYYLLMSNFL
jgi:hypothetical protein